MFENHLHYQLTYCLLKQSQNLKFLKPFFNALKLTTILQGEKTLVAYFFKAMFTLDFFEDNEQDMSQTRAFGF